MAPIQASTRTHWAESPTRSTPLSLCRGDVNASVCRSCLDRARQDALQLCPYNKAATIYYDYCFLRYSNLNFLNSNDNSDLFYMWNAQNDTDPDKFNKLATELVNRTCQYASFNSSRRFGTGEANFTDAEPKLYGLAQCTPDFSGDQCYNCLTGMFSLMQNIAGKRGGRVLGSRCNFRYEIYPFYEGKSMLQLPSSSSSPPPSNGTNTTGNGNTTTPAVPTVEGDGNKNNIGMILAIVIPLVIAFLLISSICICFWRRRKRRMAKKLPHDTNPEEITSVESILFDLSTLKTATANFSEENKLGQGGFGSVYKDKKNSNFPETEQADDLLSYVWEHWTQGTISEILDPSFGDRWPRSEALRCIQIGLLCVQEDPASRPSMSTVGLMLNSYSVSLQAPSKPAFCVGLSGGMDSDAFRKGYNFSTGEFERSSDKSIPMTPNEVSISEMEPR
ncbi:hypothetical protein J5N97_011661 [Dioscorea zingiberensis]|uniref:Gnk2-homologous domain-containing protein n=1 Tax=Dioscorea zingiberensis TaxID=325984 RepID=A0A9D5D0X8_9LILI|nr:hypothetical protein J5N97_011661 [Dioscorea zingiberensis]